MAIAQILALFVKCEMLISEIEDTTCENAETVQKKMQCFVDYAVAELDMVKRFAREM